MVPELDATMIVMDANENIDWFFITLFNLHDVHFELRIGSIFTCLNIYATIVFTNKVIYLET